jgi:hypothetical protein
MVVEGCSPLEVSGVTGGKPMAGADVGCETAEPRSEAPGRPSAIERSCDAAPPPAADGNGGGAGGRSGGRMTPAGPSLSELEGELTILYSSLQIQTQAAAEIRESGDQTGTCPRIGCAREMFLSP